MTATLVACIGLFASHIDSVETPPPQSVIVTGAAGFIGSHLCAALLLRGHRVLAIDNFDPFYSRSLKEQNLQRIRATRSEVDQCFFECVEADVCDRARMTELFLRATPACIFHLAALAGVRPSIEDPARYAAANVDGLVSVLEAARVANCRNIVFASSSSVYGNNRKAPFCENDPVDEPISPYAATKRAGELICHTYAHVFGMRVAALRFFTVYGPAQRPDLAISKFMRLIAADEEVPMYGDGTTSRDYTHIEDIIEGVLAAYQKIAACGFAPPKKNSDRDLSTGFFRIYNLGSDHPITLAEMIDSIAKVVGKPARIKRLPMQAGDVERTWADVSRSREELGYSPKVPFEVGLKSQFAEVSRATQTGVISN